MLLAIDTSTNFASLSLSDGATLLAELNWRVGQHHGAALLERADWLLRSAGVERRRLSSIAVATGPGSFNGLRVALATAKSLSFALTVPLYGIPTLDVIGWGVRCAAEPVWALIDAGRGEVYAACYTASQAAGEWKPIEQEINGQLERYVITRPEALAAYTTGPVIFTGEWRDTVQSALAEAFGDRARFLSPLETRRGAALATLAAMRAARNAADDPHALEPLYLRRPNITTSARVKLTHTESAIGARGEEGATHAV